MRVNETIQPRLTGIFRLAADIYFKTLILTKTHKMKTLLQQIMLQVTDIEKKYQSILENICKSDKSFEVKQQEIESLIYSFLQQIIEDELETVVIWNKNEAEIFFEDFNKTYKFGEMGTFSAFDCFSGYQDMFSDLMFTLISRHFKL